MLNLFRKLPPRDTQSSKASTGIAAVMTGIVLCLAILYRWYQPITQPALLQFDIFDWARQSKEWLLYGHLLTPTTLWVFPVWNAIVSRVTGADLFSVYLYSGALLTTVNLAIIYAISAKLWQKPLIRLMPLIFYAFNTQLLARSVNYLPETMSYTFGLLLVYLYLRFVFDRRVWWLVPIAVINYFYFYLHQSGMNFVIFTAGVVLLYVAFLLRLRARYRLAILAALMVLGVTVVLGKSGVAQQIQYFLKGKSNVDIAFQGQAIPYEQIFSEYSVMFYSMLIFGAIGIVWNVLKKGDTRKKIAWIVILGIVAFYYSFLYLLPNLKLYSLVPWRFYTWFSLYAIFVVGYGVNTIHTLIQRHRILQTLVIGFFLVVTIAHGTLISDTMYTADRSTLESMAHMPIPDKSVVLTTNANFLQARYALTGRNVSIQLAGPEVYTAADMAAANRAANLGQAHQDVYILISLYQLRQHPAQKEFWRNTAVSDTQLQLFNDSPYFQEVYRDANILLVHSLKVEA